MARRTQVTEDTARKREQVVQMRRARLSFAEIGKRLGISGQRAGQIYREALAEIPRQAVHEHRMEELELVDTAMNRLMAIAADATVTPRTRVDAWSAIRMWSEHKARLLDLYPPTKSRVEVVTQDQIEAAIEDLERQITEREREMSSGGVSAV